MAGIFMDSGAFSAFTRNLTINIEDYIAFLHSIKDKLDVYCCLDVIGDPEGTWKNFEIMKSAGLDPLPVYHVGEDEKYLHRCLEYDYFCLGGMAKVSENIRVPFLDRAFTIICDEDGLPKSKVHGLGMTSWKLMRRYPFFSVDSSSWILQAAMGLVYLPHRGVNDEYDFSQEPNILSFSNKKTEAMLNEHYNTCSPSYKEWIDKYVQSKGLTVEQLQESYKPRRILNVEFLAEFQKTLPTWPWPFKKIRTNMFH